jgi:hypothetical protein
VPQHLRQILVTELARGSAPIQLGDFLHHLVLAHPNFRHLADDTAQQLVGGQESGLDHVF